MTFSWSHQDFDTRILGMKTAKITSIDTSSKEELAEIIKKLITELKKNEIQYATYRFLAREFSLIHALEQQNFHLVDILVSLQINNVIAMPQGISEVEEAIPVDSKKSTPIQLPTEKDKPELIQLASKVFSLNRFYNDPLISKEKADTIYKEWMKNSLRGQAADEVLIYKENKILGFVTLQNSGHIPLVGVAQEARGKGIAKKLVTAALNRLAKLGIEKAEIETQIINTPAIRAYTSCGFKQTESYVTYRISLQ